MPHIRRTTHDLAAQMAMVGMARVMVMAGGGDDDEDGGGDTALIDDGERLWRMRRMVAHGDAWCG